VIKDEENLEAESEDYTLLDISEKSPNERDFLRTFIEHLEKIKKVVVQNPFSVEDFKSTILRYTVYNGTIFLIF